MYKRWQQINWAWDMTLKALSDPRNAQARKNAWVLWKRVFR